MSNKVHPCCCVGQNFVPFSGWTKAHCIGHLWWLSGKKKKKKIHLPMQEIGVWSLVWKEPTCHGATKPVGHNYWACAQEPGSHSCWAHVLQLLKPARPRARAPQQRSTLIGSPGGAALSPLYTHHGLLIHSSLNKHLGCFHILALKMLPSTWAVQISLQDSAFNSFGYIARRGIGGIIR